MSEDLIDILTTGSLVFAGILETYLMIFKRRNIRNDLEKILEGGNRSARADQRAELPIWYCTIGGAMQRLPG